MKTGWRPSVLTQPVPTPREGTSLHFGAFEDEFALTLEQRVASALSKLPTEPRLGNFGEVNLFNDKFQEIQSQPIKIESYPLQKDILQLLLNRTGEPTVAYAQAIQKLITGLNVETFFLMPVLKALVTDLPYEAFLSIVQFKEGLLATGALNADNQELPPQLFYSAYLALKSGAVTPEELRTVIPKLGKLTQKSELDELMLKSYGPADLWVEVLKRRCSEEKRKKRKTHLDLEGFSRPIFKGVQTLNEWPQGIPLNAWDFSGRLVKKIPNIQEFPQYIALTRENTPTNMGLEAHHAYPSLIEIGLPLETLQFVLPLFKEVCSITSVSPSPFAQTLKELCSKATPDEIRRRLSDLPACLLSLPESTRERPLFMGLLEDLAQTTPKPSDLTDGQKILRVMSFSQELAHSFNPKAYIRTFWKAFSPNAENYDEQIKAYRQYLFQSPFIPDSQWHLFLDAIGDFAIAQQTQSFIHQLPAVLAQDNQELILLMVQRDQKGPPLDPLDLEQVYADALTWSWSPRFKQAERVLDPLILRSMLNTSVEHRLNKGVRPEDFPMYLNAVTDWMLALPPSKSNPSTTINFASQFPIFLEAYPEVPKQIPQLFERLYRYKQQYDQRVRPPDDHSPLEVLVNRLLMHTPPQRWEDVATTFIEAVAHYPLRLRNHWNPYNPTPLHTTLIEAHVRSQSDDYEGAYSQLLPDALAALNAIQERVSDSQQGRAWLSEILASTQHESEAQASLRALVTLLEGDNVQAKKRALAQLCNRPALNKYTIPQRQLILAFAKQALDKGKPPEQIIQFLHLLLQTSEGNFSRLSPETLDDFFQKLLNAPPEYQVLPLFLKNFQTLSDRFKDPQRLLIAFELLSEFPPDQVGSVIEILLEPSTSSKLNYGLQVLSSNNPDAETAKKQTRDILKTLTLLPTPTAMLNHVMLSRETLPVISLQGLYHSVEYGAHSYRHGHNALPELLALLEPYAQQVRQQVERPEVQKPAFGIASGALTRLFNYIQEDSLPPINTIDSQVFNNWARIGTLGLSFTKWQYDAMTRWKGQGPAQKLPLLAASGHFTPTPPRASDSTYFGGFVYDEPTSKLHIELRRAYIVVSQPSLGTLVIRNSSPVFGRDLLKEVAYYSPTAVYPQGEDLFNPETDLETQGFLGVLSKQINTREVQKGNAQKIEALLDAFDRGTEPYIAWKCGFEEGQAPPGFKLMLESALKSAQGVSPFGKKQNLHLGWVNRYEMPFVTRKFDVTQPEHQAEMAFLLQTLQGQLPKPSQEHYQAKMPNLLAFFTVRPDPWAGVGDDRMKTAWHPLFIPNSLPAPRGGAPVRFGANDDEVTLTPHQQLANAMPGLPTEPRTWNFWNVDSFNQEFEGKLSQSMKLNSFPVQKDFIQLLLNRRGEPTLAYAQAIQQMLTGIDVKSPLLIPVLYILVSELPYEAFLSLVQFKEELRGTGAFDPNQPTNPARLLYSAYLILKTQRATQEELRTVVSKLGALTLKNPHHRSFGQYAGPGDLWVEVLKRYLHEKSKNPSFKLDLETFSRLIFKGVQSLLPPPDRLAVNPWILTSLLVKNIPNIEELPQYVALAKQEKTSQMPPVPYDKHYSELLSTGMSLKTLQATLPIFTDVYFMAPLLGDRLSNLLKTSFKDATPEEVHRRLSDLPERFSRIPPPERRDFMTLLTEIAQSEGRSTNMSDSEQVLRTMPLYKNLQKVAYINQSLKHFIRTFLKICSEDPQEYAEQVAAYQQYLLRPSPNDAPMWKEFLDAVQDFPFVQRTQNFILKSPNFIPIGNFLKTISLGVGVGLPPASWDAVYASTDTWFQSPRFAHAWGTLGSEVLGEIFSKGMGQILEQVVTPEDLPMYLNAVTNWMLTIPPRKSNVHHPSTFATYFPVFLREYPEAQKQIPQLFERLHRYKDLYDERVSPPDDDGPMETLVNRLLVHTPPHRWEDVATAFIGAMAQTPWRERENWDPFNSTPLRTTLIEAHVRSQSDYYVGSYSRLLPPALAALKAIQERVPNPSQGMVWLSQILINTQNETEAQASLQALVTLLYGDFEEKEHKALAQLCNRPTLNKYTTPQREVILEVAKRFLDTGEPPERIIQFIHLLIQTAEGNLSNLSPETLDNFFQKLLSAPPERQMLPLFLKHLQALSSLLGEPQLTLIAFDLLSEFPPDQMGSVAEVLLDRSTMEGIKPSLQALILNNPESEVARQQARDTLKTFTLLPTPTAMLNHVMLNRETLPVSALQYLYHSVEYGAHSYRYGHNALPELLALLEPYGQQVRQQVKEEHQRNAFGSASAALTRLFNYIQNDSIPAIGTIDSQAFNNWARIGTLGLSFTKWQYDAMTRWKGQGPAQQPSLLAASGHFTPTPPRASDSTYFGGFVYYEPTSKLHIELRRAYIVVSQPSLGTLVIRNSSPVFGRGLLNEVAYYSPTAVYTQGEDLFNPETDLKTQGFLGVLSKQLNAREVQKGNAQKIEALLNAFDSGTEPYIAWKCGFEDGQAPPGFKLMLESALKSAQGVSPFGKKQNLQLGWVNRYEMPFVASKFDVTKPEHQAEMAFLLQTLQGQLPPPSQKQYETQMPNLLAFLQYGLVHQLELVLTE